MNLTFYFAGKIAHTDWRHSLVKDLRSSSNWLEDERFLARPVLENALGEGLHYSGPHFNSCDHGCAHGPNQHGVLDCCNETLVPPRKHVPQAALLQIARSDILFAWLQSTTCYGSLVEIGIARALKKEIWVGWPPDMASVSGGDDPGRNELWFAESLADYCCVAPDVGEAFRYFLRLQRREYLL